MASGKPGAVQITPSSQSQTSAAAQFLNLINQKRDALSEATLAA
jgi:hypothetical protein